MQSFPTALCMYMHIIWFIFSLFGICCISSIIKVRVITYIDLFLKCSKLESEYINLLDQTILSACIQILTENNSFSKKKINLIFC